VIVSIPLHNSHRLHPWMWLSVVHRKLNFRGRVTCLSRQRV
jgi:hypothetical protein